MADHSEPEMNDEALDIKPTKTKPAKKKKKGFGIGWMAGPILLLVLAWVAPMIIAKTDARNPILTRLIPGFDQKLDLKFASLDWMSPIILHDLTISNTEDEPILTLSEMRTEQTLFNLVFNSSNLGKIELTEPEVHVKLHDKGSNLEDLINPILAAQGTSSESSQVTLVVKEATIELYNVKNELVNTTQIEELTVQTGSETTELNTKGTVNAQAPFEVFGEYANDMNSGSLTWNCSELPLESWQVLLERVQPKAILTGALTAEQTFSWKAADTNPAVTLNGPLQVQQFEIHLPEQMGTEPLKLAELKTGGALQLSAQECHFENTTFESALGRFRLAGDLDVSKLQQTDSWQQQLAQLLNTDIALQGYVDLAELAKIFPAALSIRSGMTIVAGQTDISLHTLDQSGQRVLQARVGTTDLLAEQNGSTIAWKEPLKIDCQLHLKEGWPVVDRLVGKSEFMQFQGEGSLEQAEFKLTGDLQKFATQLNQFIDPGFDKLQGELQAQVRTQLTAGNNWTAESRLDVENFLLSWPGKAPWREQKMSVEASTRGELIDHQLKQLDSGKFSITSGSDKLQVILTAPVVIGQPPYSFASTMQGSLANWQARLKPFTSLEPWQLRGDINLSSNSTLDDHSLKFIDTNVDLNSFQANKSGVSVREPRIRIQTTGDFNRETHKLNINEMTVASQSLGVRLVDFVVQPTDELVPQLSGNLALKANMQRMSTWFATHPILSQLKTAGLAKFQLQFDRGADLAQTVGKLTLENFSLTSTQQSVNSPTRTANTNLANSSYGVKPLWSEEALQISWKTSRQTEQLDLKELVIDSKLLKLDTHGKITELSTNKNIELSGNVEYDLQNLLRILQRSADPSIQMAGHHKKSFVLSGPLGSWAANSPAPTLNPDGTYGSPVPVQNVSVSSGSLSGQASFGWDSARVYGLPLGPGNLALQLNDKIVRVEPFSVPVASGQVNLSPHVRFDQAEPTLHLDPSKVMENIQLTPELCEEMLQYLAPMLADATQVQGQFSIDLASGRIPLLNTSQSDITGNLDIQQAEIRPGAMASKLTTLINQVKSIVNRKPLGALENQSRTWITMPAQTSEFRVTGGRVYHKRLTFEVDGATLHTTGSVGMDNTLNLVAEIPLQEKWIGSNKMLASMKGQFLRVPISGTTKNPIVDQQALAVFASQFAGSAAQDYLQENLGKQINKLFNR